MLRSMTNANSKRPHDASLEDHDRVRHVRFTSPISRLEDDESTKANAWLEAQIHAVKGQLKAMHEWQNV